MKPIRAIEKLVVLVGAGNAHLQFVKRLGMNPMPGVAVTLVNDAAVIAYSAMVPAHLGGDYSRDEISIDLVRLCSSTGVRLLAERVTAIETGLRRIHFADRPPLTFDVLSLGLGSVPTGPTGGDERLVMRPLGGLIEQIDQLEAELRHSKQPCRFAVVGGGATGCELALALHKRLSPIPGFGLTLLQGAERLLPQFPARAARLFSQAMAARGITVRVGARVVTTEPGQLVLESGDRLPYDRVLWATDPTPPAVLRSAGLALDPGGFLRVGPTLQSVTDPAIFGTGDCVSLAAYPTLPRNGVHAVRQGAVLFDNVAAFLQERPLRPFRPQWLCLSLLNTSDGEAVLTYGPLTIKGRWPRAWKDRIDRRWLRMFTPGAMTAEASESPLMRCGGCGSKIAGDVLGAVLKRLEIPDDPRVPLGTRAGEDAAVFKHGPGQNVEVQTVDYFKSFVDDPYLFGRVAALHAVSDIYAMNARPFSALAIATLPYARGPVQETQLHELLSGAAREFQRLGVVLAGGHTTEGSELAVGFAVTGFADETRLFRKGGLRPGDALILTKPLGTGALLAAWMRGGCKAAWFAAAVRSMLTANDQAAEVFAQAGTLACTDVTGFGLASHLLEMLDASRVIAVLEPEAVPLLPGFAEVVAAGTVSTLQRDNAKVSCRIVGAGEMPAWLFDPQTSGGLLASVPADRAVEVLARLHDVGLAEARVIGRIDAGSEERPAIRLGLP